MGTIKAKRIILGVCGSIAAYKAAFLLRLLIKAGAEVQVVMTPDAASFVGPLTFATLSGRPVLVDYFDQKTGEWNNHVHLALWADLILIAPASANTLSKFAHGGCDNLLSAIYLSARSPVFLAPAMDLDMWKHPATRANIAALQAYGHRLISPESGELASGLIGEGRLAEPEEILRVVSSFFESQDADEDANELGLSLSGKKVLITAGPTHEAIDPVRFIGNHSSGKMGFALAAEMALQGGEVYLVHGPVVVPVPVHERIQTLAVTSAAEMHRACLEVFDKVDVVVMAAAVADYTPVEPAPQKIKKSAGQDGLQITLKKTTDILADLGQRKRADQFLVGFALETEQEEANALAKLEKKNLDIIVLNSLQDEGAGFGTDTNKITVFDRSGQRTDFPLQSKTQVAKDIIQLLFDQIG